VIKITRVSLIHTFILFFYSEVEVDMTVLEELPQYEVKQELGEAPTHAEVISAIKSMACDEAPGQSKLTTDMIKNLPPKRPRSLH
jgi:hypothetical protein